MGILALFNEPDHLAQQQGLAPFVSLAALGLVPILSFVIESNLFTFDLWLVCVHWPFELLNLIIRQLLMPQHHLELFGVQ